MKVYFNWGLQDLRFCTVSRAKLNAAKYFFPKLSSLFLHELDGIDAVILADVFYILREIGVPGHVDAIRYLSEMIAYSVCHECNARVHSVMYPDIAKRRNISATTIESSNRNVLTDLLKEESAQRKIKEIFNFDIGPFLGVSWFVGIIANYYFIYYKKQNLTYTEVKKQCEGDAGIPAGNPETQNSSPSLSK